MTATSEAANSRPDGRSAGRAGVRGEFDEYAAGYDGGLHVPLKRALGGSKAAYLLVKVDWLLHDLRRAGRAPPKPLRLLDFGCGDGEFLSLLATRGFSGTSVGVDVSRGMLERAAARLQGYPGVVLHACDSDGETGLPAASFDVVVVTCVLHHVARGGQPRIFREVARLLAPGGTAYVFEHNPINPVTSWVVRRTPIDRNAVLLLPGEVRRGFSGAGLGEVRTRFLLFFPPRWGLLRRVQRLLERCPLGAQYVVAAVRPECCSPVGSTCGGAPAFRHAPRSDDEEARHA